MLTFMPLHLCSSFNIFHLTVAKLSSLNHCKSIVVLFSHPVKRVLRTCFFHFQPIFQRSEFLFCSSYKSKIPKYCKKKKKSVTHTHLQQKAADVPREDYCSGRGCKEFDLLAEEVISFRTEHWGNTLLPIPHACQTLTITTFTISIRAFIAVHQHNAL